MGMVPTYDVMSTASRYSSCSTSNTTIHAFRPENFVSLMQTNMDTKSVCSLVTTKRSNEFGYTTLDHSSSNKIEKLRKNGFGPFSYKFFVPVRVGLDIRKCMRVVILPTLLIGKLPTTSTSEFLPIASNKKYNGNHVPSAC